MAESTRLDLRLAGRERVRVDQAAGVGYRTFPARLPALLSVAAGALGVLGALGTGVRATAVAAAREEPQQVGVLMGFSSGIGWMLAVLAVLLIVSAPTWLGKRKTLKLAAVGIGIAFAILTALRLSFFDRRAGEWAGAAQQQPDFVGYHAGLGWGAWLLLAAAVLAAFALLIGVLRALDLRRGMTA